MYTDARQCGKRRSLRCTPAAPVPARQGCNAKGTRNATFGWRCRFQPGGYRPPVGSHCTDYQSEAAICTSSPDIPPPPPPPQEAKQPEDVLKRRKAGQAGMAGGTLLTSPTGVTRAALTTGAPTLLGG